MPSYEFECQRCNEVFTQQQSLAQHDEHRPVKCPKCGSTSTRQLIVAVFTKTSRKS